MEEEWKEGKIGGENKIRVVQGANSDPYGEVQLTRGMTMLFDLEDIEVVRAHYWCVSNPRPGTFYGFNTKLGRFHNVITGWSFVDHINRNGLDNRKFNLRQTDHQANMLNHKKFRNNTSGTTGVHRKTMKKRNGDPRPNWVAFWYEGGSERRQAFSITKYGEEGAKRRAVEARKEAEKRLKIESE